MSVTLNTTEDANSVRIVVTLDEASSAEVRLVVDARMNLVNATYVEQEQLAPGTLTLAEGVVQDGAGFFGTQGTFNGPLSAGQELYTYEFTKGPSGSIQVSQFVVLLNEMPGSFNEEDDLITVTFGDGAPEQPTEGNDQISGSELNETIRALGGDDVIQASPGVDTIDGGDGLDTLALSGPQDEYILTIATTGSFVADKVDDRDGINFYSNLEELRFSDGATLDLTKFGGAASLETEEFQAIIELYIAYFNRAPDALGLNFWSTAFADGLSLAAMADLFATQPETVATYPEGTSNTDFANAVYGNVLGREADPDGREFWVMQLDNEAVTRAEFILRILEGAKAAPPDDASQEFIDQQAADVAYLEIKTDVGAFYGVHVGLSNVENARAVMETFGTADVQDARGARDRAADFQELAIEPTGGAFIMPVVGVVVDEFTDLM
ncbi:MAG: DUF4214 domain-containing protein [Pseudomonadota bacterium]